LFTDEATDDDDKADDKADDEAVRLSTLRSLANRCDLASSDWKSPTQHPLTPGTPSPTVTAMSR